MSIDKTEHQYKTSSFSESNPFNAELASEPDFSRKTALNLVDHSVEYSLASEEYPEITKLRILLENGADPNQQDSQGYTIFMKAASRADLEALQLLVDYGANRNIQTDAGLTALMLASSEGHLETVRFLLKHEADPNVQTVGHGTALSIASYAGHLEIAQLLLEHGSDPDVKLNSGFTAMLGMKYKHNHKYTHMKRQVQCTSDGAAYNKLFNRTKKVCHLLSIGGIGTYCGSDSKTHSFDRVFSLGNYFSKTMEKDLQSFIKKNPDAIPIQRAQKISQALQLHLISDTEDDDSDIEKMARQYLTHKVVFISTGFEAHAAAVMLWHGHFILVNRGDESKKPIEILPIDEKQFKSSEFLKKYIARLSKLRTRGRHRFKKFMDNEFQNQYYLPSEQLEELLEKKLALPMQTVDNCAWASIEGLIFALMALEALNDQWLATDQFLDEDEINRVIAQQQEVFHLFSKHQKRIHIEKYLNLPKTDQEEEVLKILAQHIENEI